MALLHPWALRRWSKSRHSVAQGSRPSHRKVREIIAAVRQAIPDASCKPPGAVLEHVLSALRQADAKLIG